MARSNNQDTGLAVALVILFAPFVWLYNKLGWFGIGAVLLLIVGGIYWYRQHKQKQYQQWLIESTNDFSQLILFMLQSDAQFYGGLSPEEFKDMQYSFLESYYPRAEFFQKFNIFVESAWLVHNGKKRDTIEGRMDTLNTIYEQLDFEQVTPETASIIRKYRAATVEAFKVTRFKNQARAHAEKALTMKTEKAQRRYMDMAMALLVEGHETYPRNKELKETLEHFQMAYYASVKAAEQAREEKKSAKAKK